MCHDKFLTTFWWFFDAFFHDFLSLGVKLPSNRAKVTRHFQPMKFHGVKKRLNTSCRFFLKVLKNHQKWHFLIIQNHQKCTFWHFLTLFGHMTVLTKTKLTHRNFRMKKVTKSMILSFLRFLSSNRKEYFWQDIKNGHFWPFFDTFWCLLDTWQFCLSQKMTKVRSVRDTWPKMVKKAWFFKM